MAITNAQQYKQLVNPPMKGNKRPGYRGVGGYGGGVGGGAAAGGGLGEGPASGGGSGGGGDRDDRREQRSVATTLGVSPTSQIDLGVDRSAVGQFSQYGRNVMAQNLKSLQPSFIDRGVDLLKKISPTYNIIKGLTSVFGTKKGVSTQGAPYGNKPGMLRGPDPVSFDDNIGGGGDGGSNVIPIMPPLQTTSEEESTDVVTSAPRIAYRLMNEGGMADDRMPYEGGIMDLESARQMYGLGKLVKKVTRTVKKIAKSPIGKAALLYAGTAGLGSLGAGKGFGSLFKLGTYAPSAIGANLAATAGRFGIADKFMTGKPFTKTVADFAGDRLAFNAARTAAGVPGLSLGAKAGLGIAAISALPLLGVGVEDEEEQKEFSPYLGEGLNIADIRSRPRFYQGQAYRLMSDGGDTEDAKTEEEPDLSKDPNYKGWVKVYETNPDLAEMNENHSKYLQFYNKKAEGGSMKEPVAKKVMPLLDLDGQEMDFRQDGGFVPIGRMEKADDVPARLSKNEFVFTAEAVRNAGEGDIDKGAEVMYNMMKNLEAGGEVSEESQGLEGARKMFQTSQRLEEVL